MTKKPSYRFVGYTEPWEENKLGELVERVTRKNKNLESDLPLTISAQHGLVDQETFFNKKVASKDVSGYYLLKKGEFAYNKSYSADYPWGAVKRLENYEMGVLSTLYIVFRPNSIDSDFLAVYYDSPKWYKEVSKRAAEGARNHGLLNISPKDFFDTEIIFPVNQSEQTVIGSFFHELDQLINLQQRKLEVLKEQKKTYLNLLFPAKGQTKPALRFAGFEDEWKEVKLREVGEIQTGNTPPTNEEDNYEKNGFPWVTPTDINSLVLHTTSKQLSEIGKSKARIAKSGSILVTCIASIGKNTLVRTDSAFNQQINSLTPSEKYSSYFLLTQSEIWSRYMLSVAGAGTMQIINKSDFSNIKTMVPTLPEQEAIGSFFQDLDKSIAKQEEKVNHLKESKQTLLRKMFI